jgi:hypothetical protein
MNLIIATVGIMHREFVKISGDVVYSPGVGVSIVVSDSR